MPDQHQQWGERHLLHRTGHVIQFIRDYLKLGCILFNLLTEQHTSYQSDWSFWMQCQAVEQLACTETRGSSPCHEEVHAQKKQCHLHPVFLPKVHQNCGPAGTDSIPMARANHVPGGGLCTWWPSTERHWWDSELWQKEMICFPSQVLLSTVKLKLFQHWEKLER